MFSYVYFDLLQLFEIKLVSNYTILNGCCIIHIFIVYSLVAGLECYLCVYLLIEKLATISVCLIFLAALVAYHWTHTTGLDYDRLPFNFI